MVSGAKRYPASSGLTLPARSANLEIDYTALSLAMPERVAFRYWLEGVDRDWQAAGTRRQAFYTKLRPGEYRFHVIACNNDGVWNNAGAVLQFVILPAWYQKSWFVLLCVACGILLVSVIYRLRVQQIAATINARFDERLAERTRIAQELHDTLLQGFLSASMQVHVANDRLSTDSPVKPMLNRAVQIMDEVIEDGRNALRGLRSARSDAIGLECAFAAILQELDPENLSGMHAGFRVVAEGQPRPLRPLLRDEVYAVIREALINAFRHAKANQIEVKLTYNPNDFRVSVCDDGCGIEPAIVQTGRPGHWGIRGMQERAERMGARLRIFSRALCGTSVELIVKGEVAYEDHPRAGLRWLRRIVKPSIPL